MVCHWMQYFSFDSLSAPPTTTPQRFRIARATSGIFAFIYCAASRVIMMRAVSHILCIFAYSSSKMRDTHTHTHILPNFVQSNWLLHNISCIVDNSHFERISVEQNGTANIERERVHRLKKGKHSCHQANFWYFARVWASIQPPPPSLLPFIVWTHEQQHNTINWNDVCITKQINTRRLFAKGNPKTESLYIIAIKIAYHSNKDVYHVSRDGCFKCIHILPSFYTRMYMDVWVCDTVLQLLNCAHFALLPTKPNVYWIN